MSIIHVTERSRFKFCRRLWDYSYRQNLFPKTEPRNALWVGRGVHVGLAAYYRGEDPIKAISSWLEEVVPEEAFRDFTSEDVRDYQEKVKLMEVMLKGYIDFAKANDDFEVIAVETPLQARIPRTYNYLVGTLDLLVRRKGKLWVVDHKTVGSFVEPNVLELDDQMTAYLWLVWTVYGEMPMGAIYNQLRKKVPTTPLRLKSGALSKVKSVDTTYKVYLETILEEGLDPKDYGEVLEFLKQKGNTFYKRELIPRNPNELTSFMENLVYESREMRSPSTAIYPSSTKDCVWACPYRVLCKVENEKGDVEALKDVLFIKEEGRRR
ncbi:MAG: PD-(D/E)XK nuclease family protein [Candidatus Heimdallarchaeaceae archaeon]